MCQKLVHPRMSHMSQIGLKLEILVDTSMIIDLPSGKSSQCAIFFVKTMQVLLNLRALFSPKLMIKMNGFHEKYFHFSTD